MQKRVITIALSKFCRCGTVIPINSMCCDMCKEYYNNKKAKYQKKYDNSSRKNAEFYHSREWQEIRQFIIYKYNGLDLYEYYVNHKIVRADTVHHIIEIKEDKTKSLDISNLIPLSSSNHSKIHKLYLKKKKETQELLFNILKQAREDGIA